MEYFFNLFPGQNILEKAQVAAAFGAWFAGAATFCAALVALHLGRQGTKTRGKFIVRHCSFCYMPDGKMLNLIEDRSPPDFTESGLHFDVTNTNYPVLRIKNLSINSLFSRGNFWLPGPETNPHYTNKTINFGDTLSFVLPIQFLLENKFFLEEYKKKIFKGRFYFCLEIGGRKRFRAFFPKKLHKELRDAVKALP